MILVDTSVWIDHFRNDNSLLRELLNTSRATCHPFVIGELACGYLTKRKEILSLLHALPQADVVNDREVLFFIEERILMGRGMGLVDIHLLASALITPCTLWTIDKRLRAVAGQLGVLHIS